jgi:hypothetical protein
MADSTVVGLSTPNASVSSEPSQVNSRNDQNLFNKDNNTRFDDFLNYLNQQVVMYENRVEQGRLFDAAEEISRRSNYLKP